MSLKRIFSHHAHGGRHASRHSHTESTDEFQQSFPSGMRDHVQHRRHSDEASEQHDIVRPLPENSIGPVNTAEHQAQYRSRRRSSVQILDKKFVQLLSNTLTRDKDSHVPIGAAEVVCESSWMKISSRLSRRAIMSLNILRKHSRRLRKNRKKNGPDEEEKRGRRSM